MKKIEVKIAGAGQMPLYAKPGDAGCDLCYYGDKPLGLKPREITKVPTGVFLEIPEGYECQVRPRSGLALKGIITILGTVDSGYRGEICAIVHNTTSEMFVLQPFDRISQLVFNKVVQADFERVITLSESERGIGGFGHTGI
jgi:dUTP pyrophosphatase